MFGFCRFSCYHEKRRRQAPAWFDTPFPGLSESHSSAPIFWAIHKVNDPIG
jgi:hypothetical protein